jgi:hypothetical protein
VTLAQTISELRDLIGEAPSPPDESPDQYKKRVGKCPQGYQSDPESGKCVEVPAQKPDSEPEKGAETPDDEPEGPEGGEPEKDAEKPPPPEDAAEMSPDELDKVKDEYDWGAKASYEALDDETKDQILKNAADHLGVDAGELKDAFEQEKAQVVSDELAGQLDDWKAEDAGQAFERIASQMAKHEKDKAIEDGASEEEAEEIGKQAAEEQMGPFWKTLVGALVMGAPMVMPLLMLTPLGPIALAGGAVLALSGALGFKPQAKVVDYSGGTPENPKPPEGEPEEPEPKPKKKKRKTPKPPTFGPEGPKGAKGAKGPAKRKPGRPKKSSTKKRVKKSRQTAPAEPVAAVDWTDRPIAAVLSEWSLKGLPRR